jgi:hypothetical protein
MKDKEIIKALECCTDKNNCSNCPLLDVAHCDIALATHSLDLINRQKQTIREITEQFVVLGREYDALYKESLNQKAEVERLHSFETYRHCRAKAIKEFAKKLKEHKHECGCNFRKKPVFAVTVNKIDNLVKEMVGETNEG